MVAADGPGRVDVHECGPASSLCSHRLQGRDLDPGDNRADGRRHHHGVPIAMRRPDTLESFERKARLHAIGNGLEGLLPPSMLASFHELVAVGEGQVALEKLSSYLID